MSDGKRKKRKIDCEKPESHNTYDFIFELGDHVEHIIHGYNGIVAHRSQWLTGCNTYGIIPRDLDKDGAPKEHKVFDENQLIKLNDGLNSKEKTKPKETGGPEKLWPNVSR